MKGQLCGSARTYHNLLILVRPGDVRPQSVVNVLQCEDVKLQSGPVFHTIVSIKNDGHYFCGAGGNRPDGSDEALTLILRVLQLKFDESLSYPRISVQTGVSKTAIFYLVRRFHQIFTDWPLSGEYSYM